MPARRLNLLFAWQSLVYAVAMLTGTGIIAEWDRWYSSNPHYRQQVDALLRGELALSHNPVEAVHDLTWSCGGVHQVWGLGVPLWRLPFEALARSCGLPAFPDHFAFGLALAVWACLVLRAFLGEGKPAEENRPAFSSMRGLLAAVVVLLCPVFFAVCSTRFDIYEEAVAYEFIFATGLLAGLVRLWRFPAWSRCGWLCLAAGFGALVRPTVLFYGAATVLGALMVMTPDRRRPTWRKCALACALFGVGGAVLFVTNAVRFGSGFEFGHKLNLQTLYGSLYATRFDHPFVEEPWLSAARELFGLLFQVREFSGGDFYAEKFFPGQSGTVRWREMYFTTYDLTWLSLILTGWGLGLFAALRRHPRPNDSANALMTENWKLNTEHFLRFPLPSLVALWSFLPAAILCAFYLRNSVISSRYMADLAPAFCAALVALVLGWPDSVGQASSLSAIGLPARGTVGRAEGLEAPRQTGWKPVLLFRRALTGWLAAIILLGWLGMQLFFLRNSYGVPFSRNWAEVQARREKPVAVPETVGDHYRITNHGPLALTNAGDGNPRFVSRPRATIPYNGVGWDHDTGFTQPVVILFVQDAQFLELDVRPATGEELDAAAWRWVRAKVGLEVLPLETSTPLPDGTRRLRFAGPRRADYRQGLQVAYLAFDPPEQLVPHVTPYRLLTVRWR